MIRHKALNISMKALATVFLYVCFLSRDICGGLYTEEPPVKLLEVESLAERFPATESQYRVSVEDGFVRTQ